MSPLYWVGLGLCVGIGAYLVYALLYPENFQ
jgi:K+-transporting ATPase KdpF subunit